MTSAELCNNALRHAMPGVYLIPRAGDLAGNYPDGLFTHDYSTCWSTSEAPYATGMVFVADFRNGAAGEAYSGARCNVRCVRALIIPCMMNHSPTGARNGPATARASLR